MADNLDPAVLARAIVAVRKVLARAAFTSDVDMPGDLARAALTAARAGEVVAPTVDPLDPPPGWFVFGTHANDGSNSRLEFYGDDGGGMPVWERPAAPAVNARPDAAEVLWESIDDKGIRGRLYREDCEYLVGVLAAAGLLVTPEHDAQVAVRALREAAEVFSARLPDGTGNGRAYNAHQVASILATRADRIEQEELT